jgi:hypothetical protein
MVFFKSIVNFKYFTRKSFSGNTYIRDNQQTFTPSGVLVLRVLYFSETEDALKTVVI